MTLSTSTTEDAAKAASPDRALNMSVAKVLWQIDMQNKNIEIAGGKQREDWMARRKEFMADARKLVKKLRTAGVTLSA